MPFCLAHELDTACEAVIACRGYSTFNVSRLPLLWRTALRPQWPARSFGPLVLGPPVLTISLAVRAPLLRPALPCALETLKAGESHDTDNE